MCIYIPRMQPGRAAFGESCVRERKNGRLQVTGYGCQVTGAEGKGFQIGNLKFQRRRTAMVRLRSGRSEIRAQARHAPIGRLAFPGTARRAGRMPALQSLRTGTPLGNALGNPLSRVAGATHGRWVGRKRRDERNARK